MRFLGVWDIVGSFGLSFDTFINFQDINLGWGIDTVHQCVDHCFHAMALDERRETFEAMRLDPDHRYANIREVWFRGVHSDVGGGNENVSRSNIALQWMLGKANSHGALIDEARASQPQYKGNPHEAGIPPGKFYESYSGFWRFRGSRRRKLPDGAKIHKSVIERIENAANKYKPENLPDRVEEIRQKYKIVD